MAEGAGWPESIGTDALPKLPEGCGRRIEAAWRLADGGVLVIGSEDSPYEETLTITLLDRTGAVVDRRTLGGMYVAGWMEDAKPTGPRSFSFRFPDARRWSLTVGPPSASRIRRLLHRPLQLVADA